MNSPEGGDTLYLQPFVLGGEVPVGLGVARLVARGVAQHVFGEEVLRIGAGARSHAEHEHRGVLRDHLADPVRHDLKFRAEGTDGFQPLHLPVDRERLGSRLADGPPAGPGHVGRDEAHVRHDRHVVVAEHLLDVEGRRAIDAIGPDARVVERSPQVVLGGRVVAELAERQAHLHEASSGRLAHFGREEA